MKTILISYIVIINLIGFFIMGIDKRRAICGRWRVPERTLFLITLLFGSIGIFIGMHIFHHKTKKLIFAIGVPLILVIQFLLSALLISWHSHQMSRPAQIVENELALIKNLDQDTIHDFVSYDTLLHSDFVTGTIDDEAAEAVSLFFQNFKYNVLQEQIDGDSATVSVNITNIDMEALAKDLCRELLKESVVVYPEENQKTIRDYYTLLRDTILENDYDTVVTTARFHLSLEESGWIIMADDTLEDELVSGFISCMNSPETLSPSESLSIHLDALKQLTADQWKEYLGIEDVFLTCNTDYYAQIDEEFVRQISSNFDYKIIKCSEEANTVTAVVRIKSIDMTHTLISYREKLLDYAASSRSIRDDAVTFSNETARLLLEALQETRETTSTDVDLSFTSQGGIWDIQFGPEFTNALMGNMEQAIDSFNAVTQEAMLIEPRY